MKPTKNRVYCKDCGRVKMLFETQKKADTFLKFNSEDIEKESGYAPLRSYFCIVCNGWHVTSQETVQDNYISRTEQAISDFHRIREKAKEIRDKNRAIKNERLNRLRTKIARAGELLEAQDYGACKVLLEELDSDLVQIKDIISELKRKAFRKECRSLWEELEKEGGKL